MESAVVMMSVCVMVHEYVSVLVQMRVSSAMSVVWRRARDSVCPVSLSLELLRESLNLVEQLVMTF